MYKITASTIFISFFPAAAERTRTFLNNRSGKIWWWRTLEYSCFVTLFSIMITIIFIVFNLSNPTLAIMILPLLVMTVIAGEVLVVAVGFLEGMQIHSTEYGWWEMRKSSGIVN